MRKIFYNYYLPFRNLIKDDESIEKISSWKDFRNLWDVEEEVLIILYVGITEFVGLDMRFVFREFGRNDNVRFLLIGTNKQIEFVLCQNDSFLGNVIEQLILPHDFDTLEFAIVKKIEKLEMTGKGRKFFKKQNK